MPDHDPIQNAPHLHPRRGVPAPEVLGPVPGQHERVVALQLEEHVADGDDGAVRRLVHECEHQLGPWRVDPWRLIEHLCQREIGRQAPADPGPGAAVSVAAPLGKST